MKTSVFQKYQNNNCWALVTGASSGLGLYTARALAKKSCNLILFSRNIEKLQGKVDNLKEEYEINILAVQGDLRDPENIDDLIKSIYDQRGIQLNYVFLSYGNPICEPSNLIDTPWSCWIETTALYIASTHRLIKRIVEKSTRKTTITVYSSYTVNELEHKELIVADTIRIGLSRLLQQYSREYPDKLRIIEVRWGSMRTPGAMETIKLISEKLSMESEELWNKIVNEYTPLGRLLSPKDIEDLIDSLFSLPDYLSYALLKIDGGSGKCLI